MPLPSPRRPEPELMDLPDEVRAYAAADFTEVNTRFVDRLIELCGDRETADAIDLGCGPGEIAIMVARRRPRWRIVAADASQLMLDAAQDAIQSSGVTNIEVRLADAKATGLASQSFDVIFTNSLLHHVSDPQAMWREVMRLARPGATIFLRDLARPAGEAEAARIVAANAADESQLLREEFHRSLLAAYTVDEVRAQLSRAGLDQLRVEMVSDRHLDAYGTAPA